MAKDYVKQHIVPKRYLDRFGTKDGEKTIIGTRIVSKGDVQFFTESTENVGYIKNYYDVTDKDDPKYWEHYFAREIDTLCGQEIYVNQIGEIVKPGFVTAHFSAVLKANNLPRIRFHDLRHSCASLLFAQGVSLKEIQAWLGHSTIGTTANIYTHLDENNKLSSANAIIAILPEM